MGIREQLAAHDARFISVSELLEAVAEAEDVTAQEVARAFFLHGLLSKVAHRLRDHVDGGYHESSGAAAYHELEAAIDPDRNPWVSDDAQNEMNMGEPGFFRDEIAAALSACGIAVPACLQSAAPQAKPAEAAKAVPAPPQQKLADLLPFVQRVNITLNEAADLLAEANGGRWYAALEDAADSGQVQAGTWSMDRGEQPLSHADLRKWCEAGGFVWPVPFLPRAERHTDEASQPSVAELLAECEALRSELNETTRVRDELRAAVSDLEARYDHEMKVREVIHMGQSMERQKSAELAAEVERLRNMADEAGGSAANIPQINSPTLTRIFDAVERFPAWREAQHQEPNLKAVLGWQDVQQKGRGNASRVAHVAHHVIAEHFGLKD